MSVELDPTELGFQRPFTSEVAQILRIRNPNNLPVAFKVKTTAPKQYCVRPNSGRIEPDHEVEVQVLLQAMKTDPPADAKCRDKFLVQAVPISGDKEFSTVPEIWESAPKSSIQERKIRVTFLPAEAGASGAASTPARNPPPTNGVDATPDVPPPSYSSPSANPSASKQENAQPEPSPSAESKRKSTFESPVAAAAASASSAVNAAAAQLSNAKPVEQAKEKLASVQSAVAATVEDSGLKQRKVASVTKGSQAAPAPTTQVHPAAQQVAVQGVPVHIVAALCLLSFLLAYFFF